MVQFKDDTDCTIDNGFHEEDDDKYDEESSEDDDEEEDDDDDNDDDEDDYDDDENDDDDDDDDDDDVDEEDKSGEEQDDDDEDDESGDDEDDDDNKNENRDENFQDEPEKTAMMTGSNVDNSDPLAREDLEGGFADEPTTSPKQSRRGYGEEKKNVISLVALACCCLVLVIIAILLPVMLTKEKDSRPTASPTPAPVSFAPTTPTLPPFTSPPVFTTLPSNTPFPTTTSLVSSPDSNAMEPDISLDIYLTAYSSTYVLSSGDGQPKGGEDRLVVQGGNASYALMLFDTSTLPFNAIGSSCTLTLVKPTRVYNASSTIVPIKLNNTPPTSLADVTSSSFSPKRAVEGTPFVVAANDTKSDVSVDCSDLLFGQSDITIRHRKRSLEPNGVLFLMLENQGTDEDGSVTFYSTNSDFPPLISVQFEAAATSDSCNICGDGKVISLPEAVLSVPTQVEITCGEYQDAGNAGKINKTECMLLQTLTSSPCGCEDAVPTDTPGNSTELAINICNSDDRELVAPDTVVNLPGMPEAMTCSHIKEACQSGDLTIIDECNTVKDDKAVCGCTCDICGPGKEIQNESAELIIPGADTMTCGEYRELGAQGMILPDQCDSLNLLLSSESLVDPCGCSIVV